MQLFVLQLLWVRAAETSSCSSIVPHNSRFHLIMGIVRIYVMILFRIYRSVTIYNGIGGGRLLRKNGCSGEWETFGSSNHGSAVKSIFSQWRQRDLLYAQSPHVTYRIRMEALPGNDPTRHRKFRGAGGRDVMLPAYNESG